jgi:hypothetical protein
MITEIVICVVVWFLEFFGYVIFKEVDKKFERWCYADLYKYNWIEEEVILKYGDEMFLDEEDEIPY